MWLSILAILAVACLVIGILIFVNRGDPAKTKQACDSYRSDYLTYRKSADYSNPGTYGEIALLSDTVARYADGGSDSTVRHSADHLKDAVNHVDELFVSRDAAYSAYLSGLPSYETEMTAACSAAGY
jgi:hypothetical protein